MEASSLATFSAEAVGVTFLTLFFFANIELTELFRELGLSRPVLLLACLRDFEGLTCFTGLPLVAGVAG